MNGMIGESFGNPITPQNKVPVRNIENTEVTITATLTARDAHKA
jgi:hypothetical protein